MAQDNINVVENRGPDGRFLEGVSLPSQSKGGRKTAAILEFRKMFSLVAKKHITEARMEQILLRLLDDIDGADRKIAHSAIKELFDRIMGQSKVDIELELNDQTEAKTVSQEARDLWLELGRRTLK